MMFLLQLVNNLFERDCCIKYLNRSLGQTVAYFSV